MRELNVLSELKIGREIESNERSARSQGIDGREEQSEGES